MKIVKEHLNEIKIGSNAGLSNVGVGHKAVTKAYDTIIKVKPDIQFIYNVLLDVHTEELKEAMEFVAKEFEVNINKLSYFHEANMNAFIPSLAKTLAKMAKDVDIKGYEKDYRKNNRNIHVTLTCSAHNGIARLEKLIEYDDNTPNKTTIIYILKLPFELKESLNEIKVNNDSGLSNIGVGHSTLSPVHYKLSNTWPLMYDEHFVSIEDALRYDLSTVKDFPQVIEQVKNELDASEKDIMCCDQKLPKIQFWLYIAIRNAPDFQTHRQRQGGPQRQREDLHFLYMTSRSLGAAMVSSYKKQDDSDTNVLQHSFYFIRK